MQVPKFPARTLMIAVAGVAMGFALVSRVYGLGGLWGGPPAVTANPVVHVPPTFRQILWNAAVTCSVVYVTVVGIFVIRGRMTTRRWMLAVAVAAAVLVTGIGLSRRSERFSALAREHDARSRETAVGKHWSGPLDADEGISIATFPDGGEMTAREAALFVWHVKLKEKYEQAALQPWRPVPSDPPQPK